MEDVDGEASSVELPNESWRDMLSGRPNLERPVLKFTIPVLVRGADCIYSAFYMRCSKFGMKSHVQLIWDRCSFPGQNMTVKQRRVTKRRHRPHVRVHKPKHNSPNSRWRATCQYHGLLNRPKHERKYGDVLKICRSLKVPVSTSCLWAWHKKFIKGRDLTRKSGTGPSHIMDGKPEYRVWYYFRNC